MADTARVLIVDDNEGIRTALAMLLEVHGIASTSVSTPDAALAAIRAENIGVVIQDMNYSRDTTGGEEGISLFHAIHEVDPDLPVLLMTAWTSLETAVDLVKAGADDYFGKPWDNEKLVTSVRKLLGVRALRLENRRLRASDDRARRSLEARHDLCGLVFQSRRMQQVLTLALSVAESDATVLITGPNGSGKDKLAQVIQANSRRKSTPFLTVNAGGLPDELLEAELFGAEAGAFTGSRARRQGRFEAAHGGTLFLDEIGNLSHKGQMKLLRVLQTGEFERLGSNQTQKVDVRILSATNADLKSAIKAGTFREDLYFRLAVIEIHVPPLVKRPDDILPIAEHMLSSYPLPDGSPRELSPRAAEALLEHDWPGNVRELGNRIQRATLVGKSQRIEPEDLGLVDADPSTTELVRPAANSSAPPSSSFPGAGGADDPEAQEIQDAIDRASGVISRAAAELGLSRQALYRRMARLGITMERRAAPRA